MFGLDTDTLATLDKIFIKVPVIEKVLLYGSRAKGNYKTGSDIDITLLGKNLTEKNSVFQVHDLLEETSLPYQFDISIFSQLKNPDLIAHILRVGKTFYKKEEQALAKHWEEKSLGDLGNLFSGNSINTEVKKKKYLNIAEGLPYIATKDISYDSIIDYENGVKIPKKELRFFKVAPANSVFILAEGNVGKKIAITNQDVCFGNKLFMLETGKEVLSKYLFYYYHSDKFQFDFKAKITGAIVRGVSKNKFKSITIPLPPLSEQKAIIKRLDGVFDLIDKAQRKIEKQVSNVKELFQSKLEEVFAQRKGEWEKKRVKEFGKVQTGNTPSTRDASNYGDYIPFIKPPHFKDGGILDCGKSMLSKTGLEKARIVKANSILMICIGATIGKTRFINIDLSTNQQINALTPFKDYEPRFFYYAMIEKSFQKQILTEGKSAQITLPIINKTKWENLFLSIPKDKKLQRKIIKKLDQLREETKELELILNKKMDLLEELKKSLLDRAFKGELLL